jgi:hypothetical protein
VTGTVKFMNFPIPTLQKGRTIAISILICVTLRLGLSAAALAAEGIPAPGIGLPPVANDKIITAADVTVERVGTNKKTHDTAMVIIERVYGERPRFNYYIGGSQGGREGLTVAQRYPADYDGIVADVPIVNFSSLMLAPELIRIQEKPLSNWVTRAKANAIRAEFLRQADKPDGLADGVINNYMAARRNPPRPTKAPRLDFNNTPG